MFARLPPADQLDQLFGVTGHAAVRDAPDGDVLVRTCRLGGRRLTVAAFDYARQRGSIGRREAHQLVTALESDQATPLLLLVNTGGMRVTEGMGTIASLRVLLRAALDAKLSGRRLMALVTGSAFGGASMLTSLCDFRAVHGASLLGMSGPKLIESVSGAHALRADDRSSVLALLGGAARAATSRALVLCDDHAPSWRDVVAGWLAEPMVSAAAQIRCAAVDLRARLGADAPGAPAVAAPGAVDAGTMRRIQVLAGADARCLASGRVLMARAGPPGGRAVFALPGGRATGVREAMALADGLAHAAAQTPGVPMTILADTENHSGDPFDERHLLSEYLAHLALRIRALHHAGHAMHVVIAGICGGGIFGALAGGATRVTMLPDARIQVLSPAAMAALDKLDEARDESPAAALAAGAIDAIEPLAAPLA